MSKGMPHITAAELRIMKIIWQLGSCTVRQTLNALPQDEGSPPAYTTIMTMMKQLAKKGALDVDCERQPFVYTPAVRRDQVLRQRATQFLKTVFDGHAEDLVLHLVEEGDLSTADIRRIEAKIRKREETKK